MSVLLATGLLSGYKHHSVWFWFFRIFIYFDCRFRVKCLVPVLLSTVVCSLDISQVC